MKTKHTPCTCAVETLENGGRGTPYSQKQFIRFCPLHGAAPAMLEALEAVQLGHIGGQRHAGDNCKVCAAIAKVQGKENPET